jgi:flagellar motor protein MotB
VQVSPAAAAAPGALDTHAVASERQAIAREVVASASGSRADAAATRAGDTPEEDAPDPLAGVGGYLAELVAATAPREAASVRAAPSEVVVVLDGLAGFAPGSAAIAPAIESALDGVRDVVAEMPEVEIQVLGHTDDRPIRNRTYASNLDLSVARALAVARRLGEASPLARRIVVSGFSDHRPVAANDDPGGRAQNRRVEIRLMAAGTVARDVERGDPVGLGEGGEVEDVLDERVDPEAGEERHLGDVDELGRALADDVGAEQALAVGRGDELEEAVGRARDLAARDLVEARPADDRAAVAAGGLALVDPDAGDLGHGVDPDRR